MSSSCKSGLWISRLWGVSVELIGSSGGLDLKGHICSPLPGSTALLRIATNTTDRT